MGIICQGKWWHRQGQQQGPGLRGGPILTWHRLSPAGRAKTLGCCFEDAQRGTRCSGQVGDHQPPLPPTGHTARTGREFNIWLSRVGAGGSSWTLSLGQEITPITTWPPQGKNELYAEQTSAHIDRQGVGMSSPLVDGENESQTKLDEENTSREEGDLRF